MAGGGAGGAEAVEESIPVCMGGGGRDEDGTEPREIINYNKKMDRHRTEECVVYIYIYLVGHMRGKERENWNRNEAYLNI